MTLASGTRLGPYEVLTLLSAGGMGEELYMQRSDWSPDGRWLIFGFASGLGNPLSGAGVTAGNGPALGRPRREGVMKRYGLIICVAILGALLQPPQARAGVPSPAASYEDPCLIACPAGDSVFMVISRHASGAPWAHGSVTLSFCDCPRFHLRTGDHPYTVATSGCQISMIPQADGTSLFPVAGGGMCGDSVRIDAGGVVLAFRAVASPDQDGDLAVTQSDLQLVQAKLMTADPTADFDGDGVVTSADYAIAQAHLGHGAVATDVPLGPGSSGGIRFSRLPSPNPARGVVSFAIAVPRDQWIDLSVSDLLGRRMATLWRGVLPAGEHGFDWNGASRAEPPRARAGLYVVRVQARDVAVAKLFALLR